MKRTAQPAISGVFIGGLAVLLPSVEALSVEALA
jgi:hypothetical protein